MKPALACLLACGLLQGAHRDFPDFDDIVRAVSDQLHARPVSIPFFGLISFAVFVAQPGGVKRLHFALWENADRDAHLVAGAVRQIARLDGEKTDRIVTPVVGQAPLQQVPILHEGVNRQQLDRRYAQALQVID